MNIEPRKGAKRVVDDHVQVWNGVKWINQDDFEIEEDMQRLGTDFNGFEGTARDKKE